ncbi:MAG: hypothetical protein QM820_09805 [Minicystis sp.]
MPPPGLKPIKNIGSIDDVGDTGPLVSTSAGLFVATRPFDGRHVNLMWFTDHGDLLALGVPVYALPDGGAVQIVGATVGKLDLDMVVVWIEEEGGLDTVRAQKLVCSY